MTITRVVSFPESLRGKWVAYRLNKEMQIIDYDDDFEKLLKKLQKKGVDARFIQIDYVPDEDVVFVV
jgi:hypothetical protein